MKSYSLIHIKWTIYIEYVARWCEKWFDSWTPSEKLVYMNLDQIITNQRISDEVSMVQVLMDQNYLSRYELELFLSSFMRWPVCSLTKNEKQSRICIALDPNFDNWWWNVCGEQNISQNSWVCGIFHDKLTTHEREL